MTRVQKLLCPLEKQQCFLTSFVFSDVYLLGGYNNTIIFSDIWRIDLTDLQWRKMPQALEKPVYFHDSVLTDVSIQFMSLYLIAFQNCLLLFEFLVKAEVRCSFFTSLRCASVDMNTLQSWPIFIQ